ncbi:MAG: SGNH/GDSL hydrolase family protein [Sphingomicrobium sp.]
MKLLLALAALTTLGASPAATRLPVHVGGRVIAEADGSMRFGWPGTYFEGRFRGTGVTVRLDAPAEYLRLLIDGEEKLILKRPGAAQFTLDGLPSGNHVARLEKLTESQSGGGQFKGFFPTAGGQPLPVQARARQIEFIGDSFTVGYGNTSPARTCPGTLVHDTTDTQQAFGPLVSRHFDADYRVNAFSGFGVVRNYGGGSADSSLPTIYPRLKPDDATHIETSTGAWRPQIIVINLGTNDFSTPLKTGERWKSDIELKSAYRARYVQFVRDLQKSQPQAQFVLMGSDLFIDQVRQVARQLAGVTTKPIIVLPFGGLEFSGCDYHPSVEDDRKLARLLQDQIDRLNVWH